MDMDGKAVELIQISAKAEHVEREINGVLHSTKKMEPVIYDPRPETLTVHSLTALVDFIGADVDDLKTDKILLHVESPISVVLLGAEEEPTRKRTSWIRAVVDGGAFQFGRPMDPEAFNIALQSLFKDTDDRAKVLQLAGTIKSEASETNSDDGVTQTVEARRGIVLAQNAKIPNPVTLRPWRTFREIEQPASLFVFRVHAGPQLALYEADGSAWKLEAMQNVATWLGDKLSDIHIIA